MSDPIWSKIMKFEKSVKSSWGRENQPIKLQEMGKRKNIKKFDELKLSELDFAYLSYGFIPREMENKWFVYMDEKNVLRYYRSWTCVFVAELHFEKQGDLYHLVKLFENIDPKECPPILLYSSEDLVEFVKDQITLCSYCFKKIEKGDRTIMEHGAGYKKNSDKKMTGYQDYYHHFCFQEKYPHKLDKSIH